MALEPMLVFNQLLTVDYYERDTVEEAIEAMYKDAKKINRASLYYSWAVGKFVDDKRLSDKFKVPTIRELARLMKTSENSIYRYRSVHRLLTPKQLETLSDRGISTNAILEVAALNKGHKEEAAQLLDGLLTGSLDTVKSVDAAFSELLAKRTQPYNLLPGGEQGQESIPFESVEDITEGIVEPGSEESLSNRIIDAEVLDSDDGEEKEDNEVEETSSFVDSSSDSQTRRDAKAALRQVRMSMAAIKRDLADLENNLAEQMDKATQNYDVILSDAETSEEFDSLMLEMYSKISIVTQKLVDQLVQGVKTGNVTSPVALTSECLGIIDGHDLFTYLK